MRLTRDELQALADKHYPEGEGPSERSFIFLCQLAGHLLLQYHEEDRPDSDDPESFKPQTLANVPHGFALIQGLKENLEIDFPDDEFDWPKP